MENREKLIEKMKNSTEEIDILKAKLSDIMANQEKYTWRFKAKLCLNAIRRAEKDIKLIDELLSK